MARPTRNVILYFIPGKMREDQAAVAVHLYAKINSPFKKRNSTTNYFNLVLFLAIIYGRGRENVLTSILTS